MALVIDDPEVERLAGELAALERTSLVEVVRRALVDKKAGIDARAPLLARIRPLQDQLASHPLTGQVADKAFYDSLYEEN